MNVPEVVNGFFTYSGQGTAHAIDVELLTKDFYNSRDTMLNS